MQQVLLKITDKKGSEVCEKMMIVGQVSTPEEAKEIEFIAKSLVIANRARVLAHKLH